MVLRLHSAMWVGMLLTGLCERWSRKCMDPSTPVIKPVHCFTPRSKAMAAVQCTSEPSASHTETAFQSLCNVVKLNPGIYLLSVTIHICPNIRWYVWSIVSKNKDYIYKIWQYKAFGMKKSYFREKSFERKLERQNLFNVLIHEYFRIIIGQ